MAEYVIIRIRETPMKRIILAMAFFGIISACVLTAGGSGIVAIGMPELQSPHDSVAIAQRLPPNRGAIYGVIVGRLQRNRWAISFIDAEMKLKLAKWCSIIPLFAYALLAESV